MLPADANGVRQLCGVCDIPLDGTHNATHTRTAHSAATVSGDVALDTVAASENLARRSTGTRLVPRAYSAQPVAKSSAAAAPRARPCADSWQAPHERWQLCETHATT
eukprot:4529970-Prymnesium_polylepis.1